MQRSLLKWGVAPVVCIIIASNAAAQLQQPSSHALDSLPMPMLSANGTAVITIDDNEEDASIDDAVTQSSSVDAPKLDDEDVAVESNTDEAATTDVAESQNNNEVVNETAASTANAESSPLPPPQLPVNETKSLGIPNSILSARPVETDAASDPSAEVAEQSTVNTIVDSVDPRKSPISRVLLSLGLVLLLIIGLKTIMKRGAGAFGQAGRASGVIEILLRYPLDRKQSLIVLKIARRVLLLHQNGTQMTALCEMAEPMEVASLLSRIEAGSTGKQAMRFKSMLKRFEAEHETASRKADRDELFPALDDTGGEGKVVDLTRRSRRLPVACSRRHGA